MMKLKQLTAGMALMAAAFSASALQKLADVQLSKITGREGISVVADLNIQIEKLQFIDATKGSSLNFNKFSASGLIATSMDIITSAGFSASLIDVLTARGVADNKVAAAVTDIKKLAGYNNGDVMQLMLTPLPASTGSGLLNVSVGSITTGTSGQSLGSLSLVDINIGGSKIWIFGH